MTQPLWLSYSSLSTYLQCPRAYFLSAVYRNPQTGKKISIITPPLALGQAVHEVVEALSVKPVKERFANPLRDELERVWQKVHGEKGGFENESEEEHYKTRGMEMLTRVSENRGPLERLAVKIKMDLPHYTFMTDPQVILCGKLDWLEYLPDVDGVKIVDFKTGKGSESEDSLQLPIYVLLATNTQPRAVVGAAYWYIDRDPEPQEQPLPDVTSVEEYLQRMAKEIHLKRKLNKLECKTGGCRACKPLEAVLRGEATYVGLNDFGQELYVPPRRGKQTESEIL